MVVAMIVCSGPDNGKVFRLIAGDRLCVGRAESTDISFPYDLSMSSKHFQIECVAERLLLKDLQSTNGTYLNGELTSESMLYDGDEIVAGETVFSIGWSDAAKEASAANVQQQQTPPLQAAASRVPFHTDAAAACTGLQLTDDGMALLCEDQSVAQLVESLTRNLLHADALRVLSRALGPRTAVLWGSRCVEDVLSKNLSTEEVNALKSAQRWAAEPSPENAADAFGSAKGLNNEGPAAMLALAAFWGAGSLTPPGQPVVPVDPQLLDQAVSGALTLTAVSEPASKAPERFMSFIRSGQSFA